MFTNMGELFKSMRTHKCDKKHFIPSDDPQNDILDAQIEKRPPKIYPSIGFTCNCGLDFRIELRNVKAEDIPPEIGEFMKIGAGKQKLCQFLSK